MPPPCSQGDEGRPALSPEASFVAWATGKGSGLRWASFWVSFKCRAVEKRLPHESELNLPQAHTAASELTHGSFKTIFPFYFPKSFSRCLLLTLFRPDPTQGWSFSAHDSPTPPEKHLRNMRSLLPSQRQLRRRRSPGRSSCPDLGKARFSTLELSPHEHQCLHPGAEG